MNHKSKPHPANTKSYLISGQDYLINGQLKTINEWIMISIVI